MASRLLPLDAFYVTMKPPRLEILDNTATLTTDQTDEWLESDCIVEVTEWE